MTPMPGSMLKQSNPSHVSGSMPLPLPGEQGDLTTVYRRDKHSTGGGGLPAPKPRGKGLLVVGVIVFAMVGFAVAAALLHFLRAAP